MIKMGVDYYPEHWERAMWDHNECHCEHCSKRFQEWLSTKYGSLEALNLA
ncbi:beta-galactosidase [Cohnella sp.]